MGRITVPMTDFAASLWRERDLPKFYADGNDNLEQSFSFVAKDFPGPPLPLNGPDPLLDYKRCDLWLGPGTVSELHFDNYENVFAQLVGDKSFLLFPPGDTKKLVDGRLR